MITLPLVSRSGAGSVLPMWSSEAFPLVDSRVPLKRYATSTAHVGASINLKGENIRELILKTMQPLLKLMLSQEADDTKSLGQIIKVA